MKKFQYFKIGKFRIGHGFTCKLNSTFLNLWWFLEKPTMMIWFQLSLKITNYLLQYKTITYLLRTIQFSLRFWILNWQMNKMQKSLNRNNYLSNLDCIFHLLFQLSWCFYWNLKSNRYLAYTLPCNLLETFRI